MWFIQRFSIDRQVSVGKNDFRIVVVVVLVTMSRQTSPSKERQEWTSWLLPSQMDQRRPSTEQSESGRNLRSRKDDDSYDIFGNRRITSIDRPRQSPYLTSYGQHYNQVNISK